jgi:uncharacterized protein (TIGR00369 family)
VPADNFSPRDPDYADRIRASFARQSFMATVSAQLVAVQPGQTVIEAPITDRVSQQHGFAHAGLVIALLDTACGYAALSLADTGIEVLTVELKVNLLAPALGDRIRATGHVVRGGRTLTVCQGDAMSIDGGAEQHVATMLATMTTRPAAPSG